MGAVTYAGISGARAGLQRLVDGLREAAGGAVVAEAAAEIAARIGEVQDAFLARHVRTGAARNEAGAASSGGLIQARRNRYTRFIKGDPFRRGSFPPFIVKAASLLFARRLLDALGADASTSDVGAQAAILLEDARLADVASAQRKDESKQRSEAKKQERAKVRAEAKLSKATAKEFKRAVAKIWRQSAAGKAARKAAAAKRKAEKAGAK